MLTYTNGLDEVTRLVEQAEHQIRQGDVDRAHNSYINATDAMFAHTLARMRHQLKPVHTDRMNKLDDRLVDILSWILVEIRRPADENPRPRQLELQLPSHPPANP